MTENTLPKSPLHLKPPPPHLPPSSLSTHSDTLHTSKIPASISARTFYLDALKANPSSPLTPPPLISVSEFIPHTLTTHLMRRKKSSALGVKFVAKGGFRAGSRRDEITDLEGALHTFVTPVMGCEMVGDYRFHSRQGHGVVLFEDGDQVGAGKLHWRKRKRLVRSVVLSAAIQMDFEGGKVMMRVCKLDGVEVVGKDLGQWDILSVEEKQIEELRSRYDGNLRRHMVFHLTRSGKLPAMTDVKKAMDTKTAIKFLEETISSPEDISEKMVDTFLELNSSKIISLELLFNTAIHQARNEFSALEALCPQGYVYTYDPPSIFASAVDGAAILNRLMVAALKHLSDNNLLPNLRIFAFNDYAENNMITLVAKALAKQSAVRTLSKEALLRGKGGKYDVTAFKEAEGAILVIHNNSDGFGQNIETEYESGSLDGAIGSNCSGAASLEREREDLLDFIF